MDTITSPMFTLLCWGFAAVAFMAAGLIIWRTVSDWLVHLQEKRTRRAEQAEKAALFDLLVLEERLDHEALEAADRQIAERMNTVWPDWHVDVAGPQFYPPLGPMPRPPSLPSLYEAFGLPTPESPTYPGDLPPAVDVRPLWAREVDDIVRARWDA